jgi:hypothetical protein
LKIFSILFIVYYYMFAKANAYSIS